MKEKYKNSSYQIKLPLFLAFGLAAGILIGATFSDTRTKQEDLGKSLQKFKEVLTLIDRNYVDEVNSEKLVEDAIIQMLDELDPHSAYIPAEERARANEALQGNFEGIGIEFNIFKDTIVVVSPLGGGPSEAAGLRPGDKIIKVDGENVAGIGITNLDVQKHLKGPKGSKVDVTVKRRSAKEPITYTITRDKIPQHSVEASYIVRDDIGYIKISRFSATTYQEFIEALKNLKQKGMEKLILDLQGNPGGYMNHAIQITDEFLPDGNKIVYTKGKQARFNTDAEAKRKGMFEKGDLIVLVNEGSASASEIVSGALQDNDRALIVGRRTFGKGLVQQPIELSDGSELRLTISRYYTPSGRSIQKPYEDGKYGEDLLKRYEHGELFNVDSIQFNDSLKYKTKSGRVVYGGGGIMPDFFVPLDTTQASTYLNQLYNLNVVQEYTFQYVRDNAKRLEKLSIEEFQKQFKVTDAMLQDLTQLGKTYDVKPKPEQLEENKELFKLHIKAQIARQVWGNDGFYPIFNETNEVLQKAVNLFDETDELESKL
ncbi:MAG: S41 family peptidase [Candidatus Cyclobacteriaceae bacterium M2_1C_046]